MYGRHVRGQWLSWLQVSRRCLFVHSLVCVCVCRFVGVLVERPEKKGQAINPVLVNLILQH